MIYVTPGLDQADNMGYRIDALDYCVRLVASGYDELTLETSVHSECNEWLHEEAMVVERSKRTPLGVYRITSIDRGKSTMLVKCALDLDAWRGVMYPHFSVTERWPSISTITPAMLMSALCPTGWAVDIASDAFDALPAEMIDFDWVTPLDILDKMRDLWPGLTYRFAYAPLWSGSPFVGSVTAVNIEARTEVAATLTKTNGIKTTFYKGKSTALATRLYATGKDGLTFADINSGNAYVDNHTFTSAVICAHWDAPEYTDPYLLLAAATAKLQTIALPVRSFDVDIADLSVPVGPARPLQGDLPLFGVVKIGDTTIPQKDKTNLINRIAERWIYPDHPQKNKVVLSTAPARIQSQVASLLKAIGG